MLLDIIFPMYALNVILYFYMVTALQNGKQVSLFTQLEKKGVSAPEFIIFYQKIIYIGSFIVIAISLINIIGGIFW